MRLLTTDPSNPVLLPVHQLLAWAMDRGSLTHPLTFAQWLAVYALPIIPADGEPHQLAAWMCR